MDAELGALLAVIAAQSPQGKWWKSTTVFFIGDNGTPDDVIRVPFDEDHAKESLAEGGVRVPFVVSGASVAQAVRGTPSSALVNTVDVLATVAKIARVDVPQISGYPIDSVSLWPILRNQAATTRDWIYSERFNNTTNVPFVSGPDPRIIRDDQFKLYYSPDLDPTNDELYDLALDPFEQGAPFVDPGNPSQPMYIQDAYLDLVCVLRDEVGLVTETITCP